MNKITINEDVLTKLVKESVKQVLREFNYDPDDWWKSLSKEQKDKIFMDNYKKN
jgi:hypothetical protein